MAFSRQEYWSALPFSTPGKLLDPGIEPMIPESPALVGRFFTTVPPGKPQTGLIKCSWESWTNGWWPTCPARSPLKYLVLPTPAHFLTEAPVLCFLFRQSFLPFPFFGQTDFRPAPCLKLNYPLLALKRRARTQLDAWNSAKLLQVNNMKSIT